MELSPPNSISLRLRAPRRRVVSWLWMLLAIPGLLGCAETIPQDNSPTFSATHKNQIVVGKDSKAPLALPIVTPLVEVPNAQPTKLTNDFSQKLRGDEVVVPAAALISFGEPTNDERFPTVQFEALPAPQAPAPVQLEIPLQGQLPPTDSLQLN